VTDVYGVALRLGYLPASLHFLAFTAGDGWPTDAVVRAVEPRAGLLVATVTQRGGGTTAPADGRVLCRVTFDLVGTGAGAITFDPLRTAVVRLDGSTEAGLAVRGGALVLR
jgi:hypothetical protein